MTKAFDVADDGSPVVWGAVRVRGGLADDARSAGRFPFKAA